MPSQEVRRKILIEVGADVASDLRTYASAHDMTVRQVIRWAIADFLAAQGLNGLNGE
jgi:hypothetical protein